MARQNRKINHQQLPDHKGLVNLSNIEQKQIKSIQLVEEEIFSGPLPHPDILARYDQILPGGADRIFSVFENQTEHRHKMENNFVQNRFSEAKLGTYCITLITLAMIAAGTFVISIGKDVTGLTLIGTGVVLIAFGYIRGTMLHKQNLEKKTS